MKMLFKSSLLLLAVTMRFLCASAQETKKTIAGTIIDSSGSPVVAATIHEKGKSNFTTSDGTGHFKISVMPNAILEVSYTGFETVEIPTDNAAPMITLRSKSNQIAEVVVTALGIKRQRKSLGYAVQEVKGETLNEIKDPNLTNDLSGQVAGLQVVRSGNGPAGSSQIRLRGNNSLTDISQPLIVVDGMPISNITGRTGVNSTNDFYNPSLDMGNGLSDINPDDIATLTVLKGPAGAALYGSLGGNGVIIITTKSGQKQPGAGISISSTVGGESVFTAPKTQNVFGQGSNGTYSPASTLSWGPKMTGQTVTDYSGASVPFQPYNNVRNYLKGGVQSTQNISFQQQFNATSIYASYSRLDDKSIIPGASLERNNITARAVTKLGQNQRWTIDTKIQFINATAKNRPLEGSNTGNVFLTLNTLPRSLDIRRLSNDVDSAGNMIWYTKGNQDNPYWDAKYKLNQDTRNRFILYASLKYQFTSWLEAQLVGSDDLYTTASSAHQYAGSPSNESGSYSMGNDNYFQTNYSTLITAKKENLFGKLGGYITVGGNAQSFQDNAFTASAGTLRVPNLFTVNNAQGNPTFSQSFSAKTINSVYASFEADYDGYLFLNATWRNDWSSALSKQNRSFSYPSVNLSYVFTDMIQNHGGTLPSWLSFGKIRAGYATAGSDLNPYQLNNVYYIGLDPNNNTTAYTGSTLYNPDIKSQLIKSTELGAEMRFFKSGLLGFDFTWYKSNATNQIITLPLDPLSGYTGRIINAGNIQNAGIEISADARILSSTRPSSFTWTTSVNFAQNNNVVKSLYPGVTKYQLGGFDQVSVQAVAGQRYGQIYGTRIVRVTDPKDPNYGKPILNNGLPQQTPYDTLLGNQQARQIIGWTNKFSYKHFSLSVLLDASLGGKEFSFTLASMETAGTAAATVVNGKRDSMVVSGVQGTAGNYTANTTSVSPQQYWTALGTGNTGITENNLYNASNIRIRNIQLSYAVPKSVLAGSVVQKASLTFSMNNVWLISSHMHGLDPESSFATGSPATGFESGSVPSTRTYLFTLSLGF
ncbi:MAG TPA: SusC/RagA family TonB-linked outer membrane protein [Puia sp.]|jgi:TonB-linked SusC/RagA family outer membrane protein|nr:SusC/RagA family TonB-linked outer membrane protein [Puia sp.]